MFKKILLIMTLLLLASCFSSGQKKVVNSEAISEFSDDNFIVEDENEIIVNIDENEEQGDINQPSFTFIKSTEDSTFVSYEVKDSDSLMIVAFYAYGDYDKWRQIYKDNRDLFGKKREVRPGMLLKLREPINPYRSPEGLPYLVKIHDYLGKISKKVYGKVRFWRGIYNNNRSLIKDPNLIFPGFTLFYPEEPIEPVRRIQLTKLEKKRSRSAASD